MNLVIVESPAKARTLSRFLGSDYRIVASMGHIRDLPKSEMGVDTLHNFEPRYIIPRDKSKNVKLLKEEAKGKKQIILATDPDREGEAIAYHVRYVLENDKKTKIPENKFTRIVFHEITKTAVEEALNHTREIDLKLYDAQQARRILDRLVGYKLSPLLWFKIKKGLSAGRVQSVAVRLIVDREREILAFKPVEYWVIGVELKKLTEQATFIAKLISVGDQKAEIANKEKADSIVGKLETASYSVSIVDTKEVKRNPSPPFTTSTMQQAGSNRLGYSSKQTMKLAQDLYEEGFITYHRTDSLNIAQSAITQVRDFITKKFGKEYLPDSPNYYKTKSKGAQEAHEAIRPTHVERDVSEINLTPNHTKLYEMVRDRFTASQMKEAVYSQTTVDITAADCLLRATGTIVQFAGWRAVYGIKAGDKLTENEDEVQVPPLVVNEKLNKVKVISEQKFTQPPPRYTEASLIKALEEYGIGRPSTYAPTISTIQDRLYIVKEERKLKPTDMGMMVNDFLVKFFPNIVDLNFTALMEENLDKIAEGEIEWVPLISGFYTPFEKNVELVNKTAPRVEMPVEKIDEKCPDCGNPLVIREGKFGKFIACSTYPKCKYTRNYIEKIGMKCPLCSQGDVIVKKTRRGKTFWGCSNYPNCKFASWTNPMTPKSEDNKGQNQNPTVVNSS
ncbi:type I DNA topoisomerase [Candidatus Gottesmanbacteria bacterium]|nr:type I DNA topoisomerase [Candidatus Gottesmanbacteria bacterium]